MRFFIGVLLLLLAAAAPAQEARLTLEDGSTLQGVLVEVAEQHVQLRVDGRVITVTIAKIVDFTEVEAGSRPPVGGHGLILPDEPDEPRTQGTVLTAVDSDPRSGPESLFEARLGWISQRYPWIPIDDTKTLASVGMIFLLLLAGMFHFASSVTSMEAASFQRALVLSVLVVVAAAAQIGFVPATTVAALCMAGGSLVGWIVVTRLVYEARSIDALWLSLALAVCCVVSLLILEVISGVMGMLEDGSNSSWTT